MKKPGAEAINIPSCEKTAYVKSRRSNERLLFRVFISKLFRANVLQAAGLAVGLAGGADGASVEYQPVAEI